MFSRKKSELEEMADQEMIDLRFVLTHLYEYAESAPVSKKEVGENTLQERGSGKDAADARPVLPLGMQAGAGARAFGPKLSRSGRGASWPDLPCRAAHPAGSCPAPRG